MNASKLARASVVAILLLFAVPQFAQSSELRTQLENHERELGKAEESQDKSAFEKLLDPEVVFVASDGLVFTKKDIIDKSKYLDLKNYDMANAKVREIGSSGALLTYDLNVKGKIAGHQLPRKQYVSSVWVKRGSDWKLLFHQATPANH